MRLVSPGALAEPQSVAAACGWSAGVRGAWKTRLQIGISGSYGGMNLGDEAILEGILGQLRATISADVTVFSRNPNDILARHEVERAICPRSLTRREMIPEIQKL